MRKGLQDYFTDKNFFLKIAGEDDIPQIVSLINHAFEYQEKVKGAKRIDGSALRKKMSKSEFYVWRDYASRLVATSYVVLEPQKAHFGLLAIADELRGGRLAPAIIASIEEYARTEGKTVLELDYMSLSPWLGPYYEKYGFVKTGLVEDIGWAELVQMHKALV